MSGDNCGRMRTESRQSYLPVTKRKRIVARRAGGQSYRQIAQEEGVSKDTVGRVLQLPESQEELERLGAEHTEELRDQLRGIARKALRTLDAAVESDPNIAYKVVRGAGIARYSDEQKVEKATDPLWQMTEEELDNYIREKQRELAESEALESNKS